MVRAPQKPAKEPANRVTAAAVAERLGISRPSVNLAFGATSSSSRISPALRQRILETAEEMGYRPNGAARAIKRGRFGAYGLIQATEGSGGMIARQTLWGIEESLLKMNLQLLLGHFPVGRLRESDSLPRLLEEWCADGLMLHYTDQMSDDVIAHIESLNLPCVWLNRKEPLYCVHPDDYAAARRATQILLDAGHQRISYIGYDRPHSHYSSTDRANGYRDAMQQAGLRGDPHFYSDTLRPYQLTHGLLKSPDRPTAIVCAGASSDVLMAIERLQMDMPRDLSMIMLRDGAGPIGPYEEISMMESPLYRVGYAAVDMLNQQVHGGTTPPRSIAVPFIERAGQSVGPPPAYFSA